MRVLVSLFTALLTTAALLSGAAAASAQPAPPDTTTIGPGAGIVFNNVDGRFKCTLGAVGTDSAGRHVGITAGHCRVEYPVFEVVDGTCRERRYTDEEKAWFKPQFLGPDEGVHVLTDTHPVWDWRDILTRDAHLLPGAADAEPIGWIRWVNPGSNADPCHPTTTTDYMVIEFAPHVRLTSHVTDWKYDPVQSTTGRTPFRVNAIHRDASGEPAVPRVFRDYVEIFGAQSDRTPGTWAEDTFAKAPDYGIVTENRDGMFRSWASFRPGDSGGPVVMRGTGEWVGINTRLLPGGFLQPRWITNSAKNILADLNPRDITGSGFTPITD